MRLSELILTVFFVRNSVGHGFCYRIVELSRVTLKALAVFVLARILAKTAERSPVSTHLRKLLKHR